MSWPSHLKTTRVCLLSLAALAPFRVLSEDSAQAQLKPVRRILILNEANTSYPGIPIIDQGIRAGLDNSQYQLELYREYMDAVLFPDAADQQRFREFYVRKYKDRRPDVIITVGPSPLKFMLEEHQKAFSGIPIVFCVPRTILPGSPVVDSDFTGIENDLDPAATLEAALQLKPETKRVVVVGGSSPIGKQTEIEVKQRLRVYEGRLEFTFLTNLAMPALLERLKHLPTQTVVLLLGVSQDGAGTRFIPSESASLITAAANAPVFSLADSQLNHGEVGGKVANLQDEGKVAGQMALRILKGETARDMTIAKGITTYIFDSRALKRWGLKERNLPPGSLVLNRQPSIWELYKRYIISGIALILLEALLISALLWQRAGRRKAEMEQAAALEKAKESEQRFRFVANSAPVMIWMAGADTLCTYVNQPWLDFTGRRIEQELGSGWAEGLHPEDVDRCLQSYTNAFDRRQPFTMEYRIRRHDGEYCWVFDHGLPRYNPDGSFLGYIGSVIDITQRKQAEEALSSVSRRLIEAQESERTHIARELHDDVSQRLALIAVNLEAAKQKLAASESQARGRIDETRQQVSELASTVQALSHQLHSSKLNVLGVVAACAGFCREFSERHDVQVDFQSDSVPNVVPPEISICLFRILQETLQNALKHSGVRHYQASLMNSSNVIRLSVHDAGFGFDLEGAMRGRGLGLTSMRERLKLVDGELSIESDPQHGTTITAYVPLHVAAMVAKAGRT